MFKVGDRVKVVREVEAYDPDGMGPGILWENSWAEKIHYTSDTGLEMIDEGMDEYIGKEGTIVASYDIVGFEVHLDGSAMLIGEGYAFPTKALELV